jgi:hypothetical protein
LLGAHAVAALRGGGLRHDARPLIQFLDGPSAHRASLLGHGLDLCDVIATVRDNKRSVADARS